MKKIFCPTTKTIRYTEDITVQLIDQLCQLCIDMQSMTKALRGKLFRQRMYPEKLVLSPMLEPQEVNQELHQIESNIDTLIKKVYQFAKQRQFNLGEGEEWIRKRIERRLLNFQKRESVQSHELELKYLGANNTLNQQRNSLSKDRSESKLQKIIIL